MLGEKQVIRKVHIEDILALPLVELYFDDHVAGDAHLMHIKVPGYLLHKDSKKIILINWLPLDQDAATTQSNWELTTIITSAVKQIVYQTPRRNTNERRKIRRK